MLDYLCIKDNSCTNLLYINKLYNVLDKHTVEDVKRFYFGYKYRSTDIKVGARPSVSVNYVLITNQNFLKKIDDQFFVRLLKDNNEDIILDEEIEMRLVSILNSTEGRNCSSLYKYIHRYKNMIQISDNLHIVAKYNDDPSFFMKYESSSFKNLCIILRKLENEKYKKNLYKFIEDQGIINNTIFIHSVILNVKQIWYVNNVDVKTLNICYNHVIEYLDGLHPLQRYFSGDINYLLKYKRGCIIKYFESSKRLRFMDDEFLCYLFFKNKQEINELEVEFILKNYKNKYFLEILIENKVSLDSYIDREMIFFLLELEDEKIFEYILDYYGYWFAQYNVSPRMEKYVNIFNCYKLLYDILNFHLETKEINSSILKDKENAINKSSILHLKYLKDMKFYRTLTSEEITKIMKHLMNLEDFNLYNLLLYVNTKDQDIISFVNRNKEKISDRTLKILILDKYKIEYSKSEVNKLTKKMKAEYLKDCTDLYKYRENFYKADFKPFSPSKQTIQKLYNQINSREIFKMLDEIVNLKTEECCISEEKYKKTKLDGNALLCTDSKLNETFIKTFLSLVMDDYEFSSIFKHLVLIVKSFSCDIVFLIQEKIKRIAIEGFIDQDFFDKVKEIYNVILKRKHGSNCGIMTKLKKNNDILLLCISKYSKFFNKSFYIGNIK